MKLFKFVYSTLSIVVLVAVLVAVGASFGVFDKYDYTDVHTLVDTFEHQEGKKYDTVEVRIEKIEHDNPIFGDVIYLAEDVVLVGQTTDHNVGDFISFKVLTANKILDVWHISYELY